MSSLMTERPNTVSGLVAKRRELRLQIKRLIKHIRAIDGAIQAFEESERRKIGRKTYGERHRYVLDYLRNATGPVTVSEVTASWWGHKGLILDANQKNEIRRRIRVTFGKLKNAGMIEEIGEAMGRKVWRVRQLT